MSVFKPTGTATYYFRFQRRGRTFQGSTAETDKTRAKAVERAEKIKAEQQIRAERETGRRPMTIDRCFALYMDEVLAHRPSGNQRVVLLHWLEDEGGLTPEKRLDELTNADITAIIAKRRACMKRSGHDAKDRPLFKPVSVATVNRTIECLRSALYYARDNHAAMLSPQLKLKKIPGEPKHRTREATLTEEAAIFAALREDFHDMARFALLTGIRFNGCVSLRWAFIDFNGLTLRYVKKRNPGGAPEWGALPMSPEVEAILRRQIGRHRSQVWTYVAQGRKGGKVEGDRQAGARYPITFAGFQTRWRRALAKAGVADFRFHDLRHTAATRMRRNGADLGVVQQLLGHANIATTAKYSHVTQADLRVAMERSERAQEAARQAANQCDPQGFPQGRPKLKIAE
jgi:integrase